MFRKQRSESCGGRWLAVVILLVFGGASIAHGAIYAWTGGIATADFDVPGQQSFRIADLDDAATGGSYALNAGSVPEFRVEFNGVNSENPRVVNTWFAPIAVSGELGGTGLRQFALSDEIGPSPTISWGGQGFMETTTGTTIWNTNTQGYAGFRVDRGGGNFNYGWALFEYRDDANAVDLIAMGIESELNTSILAGAVPEPSSSLLLVGSVGLLALVRRRRRGA